MIKSKKFKRALSIVMSAAMLGVTLFTGSTAKAENSEPLISNQEYDGNKGFIKGFNKTEYMSSGHNAFELKFKYTKLGTVTEENDLGYNNTLQFVVYDSNWQGWNSTLIGPNGYDEDDPVTPVVGTEYTVKVPFSVIEGKLSTTDPVQGINIQTGAISDCKVMITSLTYTTVEEEIDPVESESVVLEGAWHKTSDENVDFGSMSVTSGSVNVTANAWNIGISNLKLNSFGNPIVAVTVEYGEIVNGPIYPQSEVLNAAGTPIKPNYPEVTSAGEVTYLTNIPKTAWSVTLAYDTCTVKKVEIYDEAESYATTEDDLTNENIIQKMGAGWNLGNALDSVSEDGTVSETAWGNPEVNKRLFKLVSQQENIKTVRIPVSWVDAVTVNDSSYTIDEDRFDEILDRAKQVVDMARAYDLFVILNIQHDGSEGVTGQWLDVDAANQTGIRAAFNDVWGRIADAFQDYDQHLIFESMNEVMENGQYEGPQKENTWTNINALNQAFVNVVRGKGGNNLNRFLMIPGYNTDIDETVNGGFVMPTYNGSSDKIIVSVHYYDPYNFTLNTGDGSKTNLTPAERNAIGPKFATLKTKFVSQGIPVVIGEFGAMNKNNLSQVTTYISKVVEQAKANGLGYIYWDNGYTGENGMGLWNRYTYAQSDLGKAVLPLL